MFSIARLLLFFAVFCQICVGVYSAPKYHEWRPLDSKEDYYEELIRKVDKDFGIPTKTTVKHEKHEKHEKSGHRHARSHHHHHHHVSI